MTANLPSHGRQLHSTLAADGSLRLELVEVPVVQPGPGQVVVRVEAAPINPSDLMTMLASADPASGRFGDAVQLQLAPEEFDRRRGRIGQPLSVGLGGAGTVLAAGDGAEELQGRSVAFLSLNRGSFGQYVTVGRDECALLPDGVSAAEGADVFCNPMTALAMAEHVKLEGQQALIHTAAASNLGQMLVRICQEDGIALVNVVRRQEQVDLLKGMGAEHVCNSSAPSFAEDLRRAVATLLRAIEDVAAAQLGYYSPYGSFGPKEVCIYGHLDTAPTVLHNGEYGMDWTVRMWAMPQTVARVGPQRAAEMRRRVLDGLKSTFASRFGHEVPLAQLLDREVMTAYARQSTGEKYLINPTL